MKYSIKGKNIQVTEAMEEYISSRVDNLDKYFIIDEETTAKILVRVYNSDQKIEITIPTKFAILRAEARDKDLYAAVDKVVEKLEGQLRKQKTKLKNQVRARTARLVNEGGSNGRVNSVRQKVPRGSFVVFWVEH